MLSPEKVMEFLIQNLKNEASEVPVAACIVHQNEIIAFSCNKVEELKDVTLHAEMCVIKEASQKLGSKYLSDCSLYVTLEPCPMCAYAISLAKVKSLYFGAYDIKGGGVYHGPRIFENCSNAYKPKIYGGIKESDCANLLKEFFKSRRYR
jgi:tRNA(adenine34) deaminase